MFFTVSKVFWFFVTPSNLFITLTVLGAVALWFGLRRTGTMLTTIGAIALLILGLSPVSRLMMRGLEGRFPVTDARGVGPVDGIVVLGGSARLMRGQVKLTDAAARMTEAAALARAFPQARIVFSGGNGNLLQVDDEVEADASRALMTSLGFDGPRLIYEDKSRNTRENALFSKDAVLPKPGERWLLVTSAFHMPRSVGSFRQVGFDVVPFPVDFYSKANEQDYTPYASFSSGLRLADLAVREWVGLLGYRLAGYTADLFPAPEGSAGSKAIPAQGVSGRS